MIRLNQNLGARVRPVALALLLCLGSQCVFTAPVLAQGGTPENASEQMATTTPPEPPAPVDFPSVFKKKQRLLVDALGAHAVWLDTENRHLAFWYPHSAAMQKGTVLAVHDTGHHPVWPGVLDNLVHHLTMHGWNLLTVQMPEPRAPIMVRPVVPMLAEEPLDQAAPTADQATDPTAPDAPSAPTRSEQAQSIIAEATQFLSERGLTRIVLLGEGQGASDVWQFLLSAEKSSQTAAVVLINSRDERLGGINAPQISPEVQEIPTLDIYVDDFLIADPTAEARRLGARQAGLNAYRQRRFNAVSISRDLKTENRITRTIRGFLAKSITSE